MTEEVVKMRIKIPKELYQDVATDAKIQFRTVAQEMVDKLQQSIDENEVVMASDRLSRLIFAKALAHPVAAR